MHHSGYISVFLALLFEAIGVPFPTETILISSGVEVTRGVLHFVPLLLFAAIGNIVGSNVAYFIGRLVGRKALLKYGRYVRITEERLRDVEVKFQKYQIPFLFIGKFIAFVRIVVPYLAGINKVSFWKFNIVNTIAAFAWSTTFILLGHVIEAAWKRYSHVLLSHWYISVPAAIVSILAVWWYHKKSNHSLVSEEMVKG